VVRLRTGGGDLVHSSPIGARSRPPATEEETMSPLDAAPAAALDAAKEQAYAPIF
jgi:hypothetical protein